MKKKTKKKHTKFAYQCHRWLFPIALIDGNHIRSSLFLKLILIFECSGSSYKRGVFRVCVTFSYRILNTQHRITFDFVGIVFIRHLQSCAATAMHSGHRTRGTREKRENISFRGIQSPKKTSLWCLFSNYNAQLVSPPLPSPLTQMCRLINCLFIWQGNPKTISNIC